MQNNISFNIEILIDEYTPYVYKIVNNIVSNNLSYEDKEEIVSDTFYLLWKNQNKITSNLKSYLGVIARNCSYYKLKKIDNNYELNEEILSSSFTIDMDENLIIKEKLDRLNNEEKEIFNLYYLKGFKNKEIAHIKNKKENNIKIILYRIRKKLKED